MDNPKFDRLLKQMHEIHQKKNADYSHGNPYSNFEEAATASGTTVSQVFRTLIGIKLARLTALEKQGTQPQNESVQDTYLDLAVYAALMASYFLANPDGNVIYNNKVDSSRIVGITLGGNGGTAPIVSRNSTPVDAKYVGIPDAWNSYTARVTAASGDSARCAEDRYLSKRGASPSSFSDTYKDSQKF